MEAHFYEQDQAFVLERLRQGEFDFVDAADEVQECEFFRMIAGQNILKQLADTYPSPRKKSDVPTWVYIAGDLSLRLHGVQAFNAFAYVIRSGGMINAFGPAMGRKANHPETKRQTLTCQGFNHKNAYDRETPCDADYLRKLARDTEAQALLNWYNTDAVKILHRQRAFHPEGFFIGDGSYLFVPDNEKYEKSVKLLFDEHNHPVDPGKLTPEQRAHCQWRRCYKLVTLLHVHPAQDCFVYAAVALLPGNAHECPILYELVDGFVAAAGRGVIKRLILDRGFIDGASIGRLKQKHRIDVLMPVKHNMDLYQDVMGLLSLPELSFQEYRPPAPAPKSDLSAKPVRIQKREARRQATLHARKIETPPLPPDKIHVKSEVAAIGDFRSWSSCPVPIHVVVNRETYADGHQNHWLLLDTRPIEDPQKIRQEYHVRTAIEERHRQLKCFANLARFTAQVFTLIANQVVFTILAYSLFQIFVKTTSQGDLNAKTPPRVRQEILPSAANVVIYCQNYFAFLAPIEFMEILLTLDNEARLKALAKTRSLHDAFRQCLHNPRPP